MMRKMLMMFAGLCFAAGTALAAVDVNTADQPALDSVAGVGPSTSRAIIDEREKHGNYKDWNDLERRVKGIGERNAVKLSAAGLVVNGQPRVAVAAPSGKPKADKGDKMNKSEPMDKSDRMDKSDKNDKGGKSPDIMKASDKLK